VRRHTYGYLPSRYYDRESNPILLSRNSSVVTIAPSGHATGVRDEEDRIGNFNKLIAGAFEVDALIRQASWYVVDPHYTGVVPNTNVCHIAK